MKWLAEQFGRALVRRVVFLFVAAVLAYFSVGRASAQSGFECSSSDWQCTASQAHAACRADLQQYYPTRLAHECEVWGPTSFRGLYGVGSGSSGAFRVYVHTGCGAGKSWNTVLQKCDVSCSEKPPLGPTIGLLKSEVCVGGCMYSGVPTSSFSLESGSSGAIDFGSFGGFTPTGANCGVPDEAKTDSACAPINGQTVCVRPDGQHCHKSATTKRFFCWKPGETGEKSEGPDVSKTNAGPDAIPPNINLPNGDTLTPAGNPVTVTNTGSGNTTTTTTNNYTTEHGTNAAPGKGQGVGDDSGPGDGAGDGDGEGEGDKGTVSGPGDCSAPPVCAGNALACWAIRANWQQGCDGVASGIEGMAELGDAINRATEAEAVQWGALLGNDGEGDLDSIREVRELKGSELDASGFLGAGTCPNFPMPSVMGQTLNIDFTQICGFLSNIGSIVLALSYLLGFRIIVGGGRK